MTGNLAGKLAIVTGGASGLGAEIAARLVRDGARVIVTDIDGDRLTETAEQVGAEWYTHDVTDEQRWQELVDSALERHGRLDILVNNAGILGPATGNDP